MLPHTLPYLILALYLCAVVNAGQWQCGATSLTAASVKQCPAYAPLSCSSIGGDNYCCPAGTTCQWTNGIVGCCSGPGTCQGEIGSQPQTTVWQPSTTTYWQPETSTVWQQPATTWQQPATTIYTGQATVYVAGGGVTTETVQPQTTQIVTAHQTSQKTTPQGYLGNYCSTQTAVGPNLPTTGTGQCGTILIVARASRPSLELSMWMLVMGSILFAVDT